MLGRLRGEKAGLGCGGILVPGSHALLGHGAVQPQEASQGGERSGWLWSCPPPVAGASWIRAGGSAGLQDPPPALPAAPPKRCLDWAPAGCLQSRHSPAPRRAVPSTKASSCSSESLQRERKPPVCTAVKGDRSLTLLQGRGDLWGRGDPLRLPQGPQTPAGQAGIWHPGRGTVQSLGMLGSPPRLRDAKGAGEGCGGLRG